MAKFGKDDGFVVPLKLALATESHSGATDLAFWGLDTSLAL